MSNELLREFELAVQEEASYGTSPGALAGGDFFKHTSSLGIKRSIARYDRDKDRDYQQGSVLNTQKGREKASVSIECDLIPSGNGTTPTEPDIDSLVKACLGNKHKATAHTTTAAGSTGTTLNLATGGGASSGIAAGDLIAVDIDGAGTYEVRRVVSIATDVVTIDRAFTSNPATGRTVKVGTTYRLSSTAALLSLHLWRFNGNNLRYKVPGVGLSDMGIDIDFSSTTPVATVKFSGEGQQQVTQTTSKPTASVAGVPLLPSVGKVWIGGTRYNGIKASLALKTGIELRSRESDQLLPNGLKRTGNNSRFDVTQMLSVYADASTTKTLFDNTQTLSAFDTIVQLGNTPGNIVAWCTPNWRPDAEEQEEEGEIGYSFNGRVYGTSGDDELFLAFI